MKTDTLIPDVAPTPTPKNKTVRNDGWNNVLSSVGTRKDKRTYTTFTPSVPYPKESLIQMYTGDGLISRIVDIVPNDMFRSGGYVQNDPDDEYDEGLIGHELIRLDAMTAFADAKKWARLLGGALIYVVALDGNTPDKPLNLKRIKTIESLRVFDLGDIQTWDCEWDDNPASPGFGKIKIYSVKVRIGTSFAAQKIHASRCIPVSGKKIPPSALGIGQNTLEARTWGISELAPAISDIQDYRMSMGNIAALLHEVVISKFAFNDLDEMLATDGGMERINNRVMAMDLTRSVLNSVWLSTDEEWSRDQLNLSGVSDVLDRFMMGVSSVTGIPVTRIFGRSAAGLNATGDGEAKQWMDVIEAERQKFTPELQRFVDMLVAWKGLPDGDYTFKWNNLYQLTEEEQVNVDRIKAETERAESAADTTYISSGVLTEEEVYKLRFEKTLGPKAPEDFEIAEEIPETNEPDPTDAGGMNSETPV